MAHLLLWNISMVKVACLHSLRMVRWLEKLKQKSTCLKTNGFILAAPERTLFSVTLVRVRTVLLLMFTVPINGGELSRAWLLVHCVHWKGWLPTICQIHPIKMVMDLLIYG